VRFVDYELRKFVGSLEMSTNVNVDIKSVLANKIGEHWKIIKLYFVEL
jgi:predicted SnoaL-like aldol condensation-catalyzing enzyme